METVADVRYIRAMVSRRIPVELRMRARKNLVYFLKLKEGNLSDAPLSMNKSAARTIPSKRYGRDGKNGVVSSTFERGGALMLVRFRTIPSIITAVKKRMMQT